jgi:Tol biopolymer transport system component
MGNGDESKMRRYYSFQACFILVLAVVILLGTGCQLQPEGRRMVILSGLSDNWGYDLMDMNGHRTDVSRSLGVAGGVSLRPAAWSPFGTHVAYVCGITKDGPTCICDVDIATATLQTYPLPEDGSPHSLTWTADETSFLFVWGRPYPTPAEVWQLDRATREVKVLSQLPVGVGGDVSWSWSPDRSRVAFSMKASQSGGEDLYVQNVDGTGRQLIYSNNEGIIVDPAWSPDGEAIAFVSTQPTRLCWIPVKNGEATCLQGPSGAPAWSPGGMSIAFGGSHGIRVVDTRTRNVRLVSDLGERTAQNLNWSPDGEYLAYAGCQGPESDQICEIYVVSSDGKDHRQLTWNMIADEFPVWQPVASTKK